MKFDVPNRYSGKVQFTAEIDATEETPRSRKLRLAVLWGIETRANLTEADLTEADLTEANLAWANLAEADLTRANLTEADLTRADLTRADLTWANLTRANLTEANLTEANLAWANLYSSGFRSDGYHFLGRVDDGVLMIVAGCRTFTVERARAHWGDPKYRDRRLGDEALAHIDLIERKHALAKEAGQ